jgi:RimJ/RimL family protein N-acetyltransferase
MSVSSRKPQSQLILPYDPYSHRDVLITAMQTDPIGSRMAVPLGTFSNFFDFIEKTPQWAELRIVVHENSAVGYIYIGGLTFTTKEVGIWLLPKVRGIGLATRAVREALNSVCEKNPAVKEFRANPVLSNTKSIKLWERVGFTYDLHYAKTWLAALEQICQRDTLRSVTQEEVYPLSLHLQTGVRLEVQ